MIYNWNDEDIKMVEKFIEIKNKGFYCDGKQLTDVYNRVLNKKATPTNCGSCIRQRVTELESALNQFKKQMELSGMTSTHDLINEIEAIEEEAQNESVRKEQALQEPKAKITKTKKK
jgi:hypothetical protein